MQSENDIPNLTGILLRNPKHVISALSVAMNLYIRYGISALPPPSKSNAMILIAVGGFGLNAAESSEAAEAVRELVRSLQIAEDERARESD